MALKSFFLAILFIAILNTDTVRAQKVIDKIRFFTDSSVVNATLTLNYKKLQSKKDKQGLIFPATFTCKLNDSVAINDHIQVEVRGHFRRGLCFLPPLKLIYKKDTASSFYRFKQLKLVSTCEPTAADDQNLLKEFCVYKIYNLITDKSFRTRLLNLSYQDSSGKKKTITKHAFLLEDIKEVAKRNKCEDWTDKKFGTEATNRRQTTIVSVFEYMIGNTDWSIPANHNIKVLHSKTDSSARPYVVPYDFDFSGFVNTSYSFPDERLGIENVRERLYRGFPRTMEELNDVMAIFIRKKASIYSAINNFNLLTASTKQEITAYLDGFYQIINNPSEVKDIFITSARTR